MAKIMTGIFCILSIYLLLIHQIQIVASTLPNRKIFGRFDRLHLGKSSNRKVHPKPDFVFNDFIDDEDLETNNKRQVDDYGHMRFGKRGEDQFDDYGHLRFGRSF